MKSNSIKLVFVFSGMLLLPAFCVSAQSNAPLSAPAVQTQTQTPVQVAQAPTQTPMQTPMQTMPAQTTPAQPVQPASAYTLDLSKSLVQFFVSAKLTSVKGTFRQFAVADVTGSSITTLRGKLLIDTASVFTREQKRDDHLRADDFFWSAKFPQAIVTVKDVKALGGDNYNVTMTLRIRDKEKDFVVPTQITNEGGNLNASGKFIVDRTLYDLNGEYLANKVMNDDAEITFRLYLVRK